MDDSIFPVILGALIGVIFVSFFVLLLRDEHGPRPCSYYESHNVGSVPIRCVKELIG